MSTPSARHGPEDTAPSLRRAVGLACPTCERRFTGARMRDLVACPYDKTLLVEDDPMIGRTLAQKFEIIARIGAGAMGTVYRALQKPVGREVALKILRSDRAVDEAAKGRFLREARANSLLTSAHTVMVFDFGESETGDFFLAMELLDGESLGQRLKRVGRLVPTEAVDMACQALRSLAEAHAKGIVHRDLKPDNLFFASVVDGGETVKVLDFGIAKMLRGDDVQQFNAVETQAGTVFGTPRYMSPEQAQGKTLDARSDLYSLGVILYQALTGQPPFTDDDAIVVMARHIKTAPKLFAEVAPDAMIPPDLERVVMSALSKEQSARPLSAEVMGASLAVAIDSRLASTSGVRLQIPTLRPRPPSAPPPPSPKPDKPSAEDSFGTPAAGTVRRPRGVAIAFVSGVVIALAIALGIAFVTRGSKARVAVGAAPPLAASVATTARVVATASASVPAPIAVRELVAVDAAAPMSVATAPAMSSISAPSGGTARPRPRATADATSPAKPPTTPSSPGYGLFE